MEENKPNLELNFTLENISLSIISARLGPHVRWLSRGRARNILVFQLDRALHITTGFSGQRQDEEGEEEPQQEQDHRLQEGGTDQVQGVAEGLLGVPSSQRLLIRGRVSGVDGAGEVHEELVRAPSRLSLRWMDTSSGYHQRTDGSPLRNEEDDA